MVGVHPETHSLGLLWCQCPIFKQAFHTLTLSQALLIASRDSHPIGLVPRIHCGASHERQQRECQHSKLW
jgi:hypothetical protein